MTWTTRTITAIAALGWAVVGGYGIWIISAEESGDDWQVPYAIGAIGLVLGGALTVGLLARLPRRQRWRRSEQIGLGVGILGVVFGLLAAWALPVWMTLFAVSFALIAVSGTEPWRRWVYALAASQLAAIAAMFAGIAGQIGRENSFGDHPVAFGLGLFVVAAATILSLHQLGRTPRDDPLDGGEQFPSEIAAELPSSVS